MGKTFKIIKVDKKIKKFKFKFIYLFLGVIRNTFKV